MSDERIINMDNDENLTPEQLEDRNQYRKMLIIAKIASVLKMYDITYIPIRDDMTLAHVCNLLFCGITEPDDQVTGLKSFYYGAYFHMKKNEELMNKWYRVAIRYGYDDAMAYMGYYYDQKKKYRKMKKWYNRGIKVKNARCMFNLASHYHCVRMNRKRADKWYKKAIKYGCKEAYINYGFFNYERKDYETMKEYYHKAIEYGDYNACANLATFYNVQGDIDNMMKYLNMGAQYDNKLCLKFLYQLYRPTPEEEEEGVKIKEVVST